MKLLVLLFFLIALLYSSVGFGGGSSYTALLVIFDIDYRSIPIISLICNIIVVSTGTFFYIKNKLLDKKLITSLVIFSMPMSYLGGSLVISEQLFIIILGLTLLVSALLLFIAQNNAEIINEQLNNWRIAAVVGAPIGLIAGITGIGGGIFLAPILHLLKIAKTKTIAATACLFILLNSSAGLVGQLSKYGIQVFENPETIKPLLLLPIAVLFGGFLGNRVAIKYFSALQLRRMTAILVFVVAVRLIIRYFNY